MAAVGATSEIAAPLGFAECMAPAAAGMTATERATTAVKIVRTMLTSLPSRRYIGFPEEMVKSPFCELGAVSQLLIP